MEKIKSHYSKGGFDKFTRVSEYSLPISVELNSKVLDDYMKSVHRKNSVNLKLDFVFKQTSTLSELTLKLVSSCNGIGVIASPNLKDVELVFLLDETEVVKSGKLLDLQVNLIGDALSPEGNTYFQTAYIESDVSFLTKCALASKIEYRVTSNWGKMSEDELNLNEIFKIKGFYNSHFDPEYLKEELLSHIDSKSK